MNENTHKQFSANVCSKCGMPAPDWKCPVCGAVSKNFDPRHFAVCKGGGKMQPQCSGCGEAESKCTCV